MAKKEKKKNKLKSLVLLLLLTVVMLSTATYAWFTANRSVTINNIDVHVAASSGLQISTDAASWKAAVTNTDITTGYDGHTNVIPNIVSSDEQISPVSTDGTVADKAMVMYSGDVKANGSGVMALTTTLAADSSKKFVVFDVFLKYEGDSAVPLYLAPGSGVIHTNTGSTTTVDKGLKNAARYGFVNLGTDSDAAATQDDVLSYVYNGSTSYIIEPNYDTHTNSGVTYCLNTYGITTSTTAADPITYLGVKGAVTEQVLSTTQTSSSNFGTVNGLLKTNDAYSTGSTGWASLAAGSSSPNTTTYLKLMDLPVGITKLRVYMWVEGQDCDCENGASGDYLSYFINFTLDSSN